VSNATYDGAAIVGQCREAARARLGAQLPTVLAAVADRLAKESQGSREEREQYAAAAQRLRDGQGDFVAAFQSELAARIDAGTQALKSGILQSDDEDLSTLKTNLLENQVAVNKLAVLLKQAAGDELARFSGRIAAVFGRRMLDDGDNPLGPMTIAFAVYAGVDALGLQSRASRALRPDLEKGLAAPVCELYKVMNGALERAGIAPAAGGAARPEPRAAADGPPTAAAEAAAAKTVAAMLGVAAVPPPVAAFLTEIWARVLARAHAQGTDSAPWREAVDVMNELIASVKPGIDPDERARLKSVLPGLLKQLQAGMNAIALEPAKRQEVLDMLMVHHRDIIVGPRAHA